MATTAQYEVLESMDLVSWDASSDAFQSSAYFNAKINVPTLTKFAGEVERALKEMQVVFADPTEEDAHLPIGKGMLKTLKAIQSRRTGRCHQCNRSTALPYPHQVFTTRDGYQGGRHWCVYHPFLFSFPSDHPGVDGTGHGGRRRWTLRSEGGVRAPGTPHVWM